MEIQNKDIEQVVMFLKTISPLPAKQSRMKAKFIKMCLERLKEIEEDQMLLIEEFGDRDDQGNLIMIKEGHYSVKKRLNEFNRAYAELLSEYWVIDETESIKDVLLTLKDIVLNYEGNVDDQHALIHDMLCDQLENLSYED
jgi:hypothetical protein